MRGKNEMSSTFKKEKLIFLSFFYIIYIESEEQENASR